MSNTNTGGPAFPLETSTAFQNPGMALRDYFAAKAMQGMLADTNVRTTPEEFAEKSYVMADAMLKAREEA